MNKPSIVASLLLDCEFDEDLPDYIADGELLGYAEHLPQELRDGYLSALLGFFQIYERLDVKQRAAMLEQLEEQLESQFAHNRSDH